MNWGSPPISPACHPALRSPGRCSRADGYVRVYRFLDEGKRIELVHKTQVGPGLVWVVDSGVRRLSVRAGGWRLGRLALRGATTMVHCKRSASAPPAACLDGRCLNERLPSARPQVDGVPGAMAAFKGRLLVGVDNNLRLYDMGA